MVSPGAIDRWISLELGRLNAGLVVERKSLAQLRRGTRPACRPRAGDEDAVGPAAPARLARRPPLIKGYLRLGGFVGDGAVIDPQFNTVDVFIMVKTDWVTDRYYRHYTREDAPSRARAERMARTRP